jgi:hypothetical protein
LRPKLEHKSHEGTNHKDGMPKSAARKQGAQK